MVIFKECRYGYQNMKQLFISAVLLQPIKLVVSIVLILLGFGYLGMLFGLLIYLVLSSVLFFSPEFVKGGSGIGRRWVIRLFTLPSLLTTLSEMLFNNVQCILVSFFRAQLSYQLGGGRDLSFSAPFENLGTNWSPIYPVLFLPFGGVLAWLARIMLFVITLRLSRRMPLTWLSVLPFLLSSSLHTHHMIFLLVPAIINLKELIHNKMFFAFVVLSSFLCTFTILHTCLGWVYSPGWSLQPVLLFFCCSWRSGEFLHSPHELFIKLLMQDLHDTGDRWSWFYRQPSCGAVTQGGCCGCLGYFQA